MPRDSTERAWAPPAPARMGLVDRAAIALSSLCLVHCVATVLLAATLASAGAALANPLFHEVGFAIAMLLGAAALGRGYLLHRRVRPLLLGAAGLALMGLGLSLVDGLVEIAITMAGVTALAIAHRLNAGHHRHRPRHPGSGLAERGAAA